MNFNKLLVNKTFLYVVFFLAITNVLGYLFMGDEQALTQFILIGIITYFFNKNMAVVLLVALLMTNFLKVTSISVNRKEGMENKEEDMDMEEEEGGTDLSMDMMEQMQEQLIEKVEKASTPALKEPRRKTKNSRAMEKEEFLNTGPTKKTKKEKFQNSKKKGGNYVDQAATLEAAYDNLDGIIGKDGINKLTAETSTLLSQQKNLAKTMESMAPLVKNAKEMLSGFNFDSLKAVGGAQGLMK
jgi:outer membrane murein-binding lipoprotein Lpp